MAAKSKRRASNPTVQAQNVMMMKWGKQQQHSLQSPAGTNVFDEYQAVFGAPLSESKCEAIRTLFPAGAQLEDIVLVDGLDLEDM